MIELLRKTAAFLLVASFVLLIAFFIYSISQTEPKTADDLAKDRILRENLKKQINPLIWAALVMFPYGLFHLVSFLRKRRRYVRFQKAMDALEESPKDRPRRPVWEKLKGLRH